MRAPKASTWEQTIGNFVFQCLSLHPPELSAPVPSSSGASLESSHQISLSLVAVAVVLWVGRGTCVYQAAKGLCPFSAQRQWVEVYYKKPGRLHSPLFKFKIFVSLLTKVPKIYTAAFLRIWVLIPGVYIFLANFSLLKKSSWKKKKATENLHRNCLWGITRKSKFSSQWKF